MFGQFSGLAVTDDGSQLYFSSSLQLIGSKNEVIHTRRFFAMLTARPGGPAFENAFRRSDGGGSFHLAAQVDKVATGAASGALTNFYSLSNPYVSGDGSVTGYVGTLGGLLGNLLLRCRAPARRRCNPPFRRRSLMHAR